MSEERERRRETDMAHNALMELARNNAKLINQNSEDVKQLINEYVTKGELKAIEETIAKTVTKEELIKHGDDEMRFVYWCAGVSGAIILICGAWFYNHEKEDMVNHMTTKATLSEYHRDLKYFKESSDEMKEILKEISKKVSNGE